MTFFRATRKHDRNVSAPATAREMPTRRRRPSIVDGRILEPEWSLESQTHGSFTQDTLNRVAQAQAEEAGMAHPRSELPNSQSSSPHRQPRISSMNWSAPMQPPSQPLPQLPSPPKQKNQRYYSNNLSDEDVTALAIGVENNNLREWDGADLIRYQVARIEMVPYTEKRQEIIAVILDEKRESERFVLKSVRQAKRFVGSPLTKLEMVNEVETYEAQSRNEAARSMVDLRAVSTPSLPLTPTSPTLQTSQDSFPFPTAEPKRGRQNFYNHNSQSEFFDRQTPCGSMEQSPYSSDTSRNSSRHRVSQWPDRHHVVRKADRSSRARSSLTPDGRPYVAKADVTFDSFLAPHASGKGETHRDSQYVKKGREPRSFSRRLSKMPSMPQLKKRASQAFSFSQKD